MSFVSAHSMHGGASWVTNPYVRWRHPVARVVVASLVLLLDFFSFWTDPVNDSHVEYMLPGFGSVFSFLAQWPADAGLIIARLGMIFLCCIAGVYCGRQWLHHCLLRDCCRLTMFTGSRGSFLAIGLCTSGTLLVGVKIYNGIIPSRATPITGATGVEACIFSKVLQCVSALVHSIALLQIFDGVLQDRHWYPDWADTVKQAWNEAHGGWIRVLSMRTLGIMAVTLAVLMTQATDLIGGLSEIPRILVGSVLMALDFLIILQDWEFPTFDDPADLEYPIFIAGTFRPKLSCRALSELVMLLKSCLARVLGLTSEGSWDDIVHFCSVTITGPWLSYGLILCAIGLDLIFTCTQLRYCPQDYGQYVDPDTNRIWTIVDSEYLQIAYKAGVLERPELVTWSARRNSTTGAPLNPSAATDLALGSEYAAVPMTKYLAILPGLLSFLTFAVLVGAGERAGRPPAPVKKVKVPKLPAKPSADLSPRKEGTSQLECMRALPRSLTSPSLGRCLAPLGTNSLLPLRLTASAAVDQEPPDVTTCDGLEDPLACFKVPGSSNFSGLEEETATPRRKKLSKLLPYFDVLLRREGRPLGLQFEPPQSALVQELLVTEVLVGSAVGDHNLVQAAAGNWEMVVMPGMLISSVNGIRGEPEAMADALLSEEVLTVRFVPVTIAPPFVMPRCNRLAELLQSQPADESRPSAEGRDATYLVDASTADANLTHSAAQEVCAGATNCVPRRPAVPPPSLSRHTAPHTLPSGLPPALPLHGPPAAPLQSLLGRLVQGVDDGASSSASEESV